MSRKANAELLKEFQKNPSEKTYEAVAGGLELPANIGAPKVLTPEGKEIATVGANLLGGGKEAFVDKDRPKNFARFVAGFQDFFDSSKDRDKLGGVSVAGQPFDPYEGVELVGDAEKKFSPVQAKRIEKYLKAELEEPKTALEQTEEYAESLKALYGDKELRALRRRDRTEEAIQNQIQYMATEPVRQAFLNRAAEQAAQRGLRVRGALEAMPSNIQNIMLSKQAQAATASSAEAERARAAADQQDAATRFAGLGMQRRFG